MTPEKLDSGNTDPIDFPFLTGASPPAAAHVEDIGRSNVKHWDIGGLVRSGEAPRGASPVRLVTAESMWGHRFRAFGFPPGRDYGEWAVGKIMDAVEGDWLQIDPVDFRGARVREGYSGTPVWDESLEGTAGMVVAADKGDQDRIAYILPASILVEAWSLVLKANSISPCPYRGLSAFTECESQSFFGREAFLATLLEVVKRPTSTILIAPSGSGQTLVLMAGARTGIEGARRVARDRGEARPRPVLSLSYAVSETMDARQSAPSWAKNPFEVLEAMKRQPLVEVLSQLLRVSGCGRLLLIADQFEELFTLCRDAKVRDRWLEELIGVGSDLGGGVQALVSMRSDYERRGKVGSGAEHGNHTELAQSYSPGHVG